MHTIESNELARVTGGDAWDNYSQQLQQDYGDVRANINFASTQLRNGNYGNAARDMGRAYFDGAATIADAIPIVRNWVPGSK